MGLLSIAALVLQIFLRVYVWILWGRFIIDWVRVLVPTFRPKGVVLVIFETIATLTDPPLKAVRKVLPPIRLGQIQLDLGWLVTLIACWIAIGLLSIVIY
ncbi:MAG: YggT family protein [Canibacter sp.]